MGDTGELWSFAGVMGDTAQREGLCRMQVVQGLMCPPEQRTRRADGLFSKWDNDSDLEAVP